MIPVAEPDLSGNEKRYVDDCLESTWISSKGDYIKRFEKAFSEYCGTKHAITTSNGTTALHLALEALGIGEGDEVIIPNLTFIATANAVRYCNAIPVLIDVDPETWNIDVSKIEEKITEKTKAVIPVHLYGNPCDMAAIRKLATKHNLRIIEDSAEAIGATINGQKVGTFSDIACFSFYGNKIITTGEGGMCLTDNDALAEKMRLLKNHGMDPEKRYWHTLIGFNYRMTNIQAAIGLAQLEQIETFLEKKQKNATLYQELLPDMEFAKTINNSKNVHWLVTILCDKEKVMAKLTAAGVDTRPVFHPLSTMPPYQTKEAFPVSDAIFAKGVSLPSSTTLTQEQILLICDAIKN